MTSEEFEILAQIEARAAAMEMKDRARAMHKAATAPHTLTEYETRLIDYVEPPKPKADTDRLKRIADVLRPSWLVFRNAEIRALNDHAISIAMAHQINVTECSHGEQSARRRGRLVNTPAVSNEETYCVFLHEAGHIVSPDGDSTQYRYHSTEKSIVSPAGEVGAWRWAIDTAQTWTREMQDHMCDSLRTYARGARPHERESMELLVSSAALKVYDRPWTVAELDERCAELRGAAQ